MASRLDGYVRGQKRFLGDIAHELCSPLARLRVALGIIEERAGDGDGEKRYALAASEKAQQMADLVNELLSFSRASLGATAALRLQPVALRDVVLKAMHRETVEGADVRVDVPEELAVTAEPELLVRALSNLVRNALRHAGPVGPILVEARRENQTVLVTVADSGPGVPDGELTRIFEPFHRLDASRDRTTGGIGLGLTIVKTCIESCGGTVVARNRPEGGLEVRITLPAA